MASALFSPPGMALATFLHTLGAIGYLAGIAFYVGWKRSLFRGHHAPSVLATGAALTYVSIFANLVGGFLRTYQPGHPSLTAFADEPWVMLMAVKHAALFAGIFAAVWLFEIEAPGMLRARKKGGLKQMSQRRPRAMAATVILSIVIASVLGGASGVVGIGEVPDEPDPDPTEPEENATVGPYHFEGQVTTQGGVATGTFAVPEGAVRIEATLVGTGPSDLFNPAQYSLALRDETGATDRGSTDPSDPAAPRQIDIVVDRPFPGTWTYEVRGDAAVGAQWELDIIVS